MTSPVTKRPMDAGELRLLRQLAKQGKGGHRLIDILGQVGRGKHYWTEQQRVILRRLARRRYVEIGWEPQYGDDPGRYNVYELTTEGRRALHLERAKK